MTYGLRCRDASGNIFIDENDRLPAIIGSYGYSMGSGVTNTTISVPGAHPSTHFAHDPSNNCLCLVQSGSVKVTRVRSGYSASESGSVVVFRA